MIFDDGTSHSEIFDFFLFFRSVRKIQKVTIRFVMSVCPSVYPHEKLRSHWKDFHEILYLRIFRKYVGKFKFP